MEKEGLPKKLKTAPGFGTVPNSMRTWYPKSMEEQNETDKYRLQQSEFVEISKGH
ncbi:hypothetical protein QNH10_19615 [Sporosarcina thermotolerans]|uniref:hypothetical protein n=1 Tax=Sporosarcina thermotolerans TaxID=633404 RepID=UPI0024BCE7A6|nr:hypothetical protein [Sporosarcina thermotolerans]WHT48196.1 hypothetical protein QNH10_19615 [Sporosarcina thermotolerans]